MEEEIKEEKEVKQEPKKRLSPESTLLLTIGATAAVLVMCGIIHLIVTKL